MGPHQMDQADQQLYPFTDAELARLAIYQRAVKAGFYTDDPDATVIVDDGDFTLDWLDTRVEGYAFSRVELQRMATYKLAVAIGLYTDRLKGGYGTDRARAL